MREKYLESSLNRSNYSTDYRDFALIFRVLRGQRYPGKMQTEATNERERKPLHNVIKSAEVKVERIRLIERSACFGCDQWLWLGLSL